MLRIISRRSFGALFMDATLELCLITLAVRKNRKLDEMTRPDKYVIEATYLTYLN